MLLSRLHRAAYEAITAVNEAAPIKPDLKAVLILLDDCFKAAFGRSFSPSILGLLGPVSADNLNKQLLNSHRIIFTGYV